MYDNNFGAFGENFFQKIFHPIVAVAQRARTVVRQTAQEVSRGNILKAIAVSNPIYLAAKLTSDNTHIQNIAAMTFPTSVTAISDYSLRKKVAIGYAAAAAIAVTAGASTGAVGGGEATAAGATEAGAGALSTTTGVIAAGTKLASAILPKKSGEQTIETTQPEKQNKAFDSEKLKNVLLPVFLIVGGFAAFTSIKSKK